MNKAPVEEPLDGTAKFKHPSWLTWLTEVSSVLLGAAQSLVNAAKLGGQTLAQIKADTLNPTAQASVTATRAAGVVYQNTSDRPMFVTASLSSSGAGCVFSAYTDAANPPTTVVGQMDQSPANYRAILAFVVIPGNYYKATVSGGAATVHAWTEWS